MIVALGGLYHVVILLKIALKLHCLYSLTLLKMIAYYMAASTLMRLSGKMEASHMAAILFCYLFIYLFIFT